MRAKELSEITTHLAFDASWGNAMGTVEAAGPTFAERGIGVDQLPPALSPLDSAAEARRATAVEASVGSASPGLVKDTGEVQFCDLGLRPDLGPRDRSLVTVAALIANGLTATEAGELVSHLANYAGGPNAFSAVPAVKSVLAETESSS